MARTQIPLSTLTASSPAGAYADLNDAGTAIDQSNGMYIDLSNSAVPATGSAQDLLIYVKNSYSGTQTVTIKAGANPPAFRQGLGDYTTGNLTGSTGTAFIGPLDSSRFLQTDGKVNVDFSASATGTIWAVLIPRSF